MPSESDNPHMRSWRIFRRRASADTFVGIVVAPDRAAAIEKAIQKFEITEPTDQQRLVAQPRDW